MKRPSAALTVAFLALLGAWGGPAVAARLLTGNDIRDRSLTGREFRSNSLTGRVVGNLTGRDVRADSLDGTDIDESSLGEVRRARDAATAATAERAATADRAVVADALEGAGVQRVSFARPAGNEAIVLDMGGLRLRARCGPSGTLTVSAINAGESAFVRAAGTLGPSGQSAPSDHYAEDDDFRPAEEVVLLPDGTDNLAGQIVYSTLTGPSVTVTFLAEQGVAATRGIACIFSGTAVRAG